MKASESYDTTVPEFDDLTSAMEDDRAMARYLGDLTIGQPAVLRSAQSHGASEVG